MNIDFLINSCVESRDGFNHIGCHLTVDFLRKYFFVLVQDFRVHTKTDFATQYICPYLMIRTFGRQGLQKAVGIKNDASHNDKGCACVLRPTALWFHH